MEESQQKANYYVDKKKLYDVIVEYKKRVRLHKKEGLQPPRIPEYAGEAIYKIANKLSYKPSFINYSFKDDMIADGIENCVMYFDNFDPEKGNNPFAYFTQIIKYAFIRRIGKEEKSRYTKYKHFLERFVNTGDMSLLIDSDEDHLLSFSMYDNIVEFMEKFEAKELKKKAKRKENKKKRQLLSGKKENEEGTEFTDASANVD